MITLLDTPRRFPGGIRMEPNKAQSLRQPVRPARLPERLYVPLSQHIGEPAEALVAEGDSVLKGQLIARSLSYISAPIHAPTSGRVIDIGDYRVPHPSGLKAPCIVIAADGADRSAATGMDMASVLAADPDVDKVVDLRTLLADDIAADPWNLTDNAGEGSRPLHARECCTGCRPDRQGGMA